MKVRVETVPSPPPPPPLPPVKGVVIRVELTREEAYFIHCYAPECTGDNVRGSSTLGELVDEITREIHKLGRQERLR